MASVTQRIGQIKQPQGGYLPVSQMEKIQLKDNNELSENENISAALIGMAVDYMTRYLSGASKEDAFKISLMGASIINETRFAQLPRINPEKADELLDLSIKYAKQRFDKLVKESKD